MEILFGIANVQISSIFDNLSACDTSDFLFPYNNLINVNEFSGFQVGPTFPTIPTFPYFFFCVPTFFLKMPYYPYF